MNNLQGSIGNRNSSSSQSSSDGNATREKLVLLGKPTKRFDLADVVGARKRELGKGTVGTAYKADLEDRTTTVVVKMLEDVVLSAEDFRKMVRTVGAMDHENLLPLRGYFYSQGQKFLVYDYMRLGSLSSQLHGHREPLLSWEVRLSIGLEAARAIEHLHAQNIHHGNVKSSNVLLTPSSYEARVSDYGLTPLTKSGQAGWADPMADVYGFGMLLLGLLTGKQPAEVLLDLAISCVSPNSDERPRMSEVRRKIEELCSPGGRRDGDSRPDKISERTKDTSSRPIHSKPETGTRSSTNSAK